MPAKRFRINPESLLPLLRELEAGQYEQMSEKILETDSMVEIRRWLEKVNRQ